MQDEEHKRKNQPICTDASPPKIRKTPQPNGRFIDTMISQWLKSTGAKIPPTPGSSNRESMVTSEIQMKYNEEMHKNETLQRKYQDAEERITTLSKSLDAELNIRDEITEKLDATWESIDTITNYCNYISDTLIAFQQHRTNLSKLYDNVIAGQSSAVERLQGQLSDARDKCIEQERMVADARGQLDVYEKRTQELAADNNGLRKQLQCCDEKFSAEKSYLINAHTEEKLKLIREHEATIAQKDVLKLRLEQQEDEKRKIVEALNQKENCVFKCQNEIVSYKSQAEALLSAKNELSSLYEGVIEDKRKLSERLELSLSEAEQLRFHLNDARTKENDLTKRLNALEKKLAEEATRCAKIRENLVDAEVKLKSAEVRNEELEKIIESGKGEDDAMTSELHKKIGTLQKEKDDLLLEKQTDMDELRTAWEEKHNSELSTLKRDLEANVSELQKAIVRSKNDVWKLNVQLDETKKESDRLKEKFFEAEGSNDELRNKLKIATDELEKKTASESQLRDKCNKYQAELKIANQMYKNAQENLQKQTDIARNGQDDVLERILTPIIDDKKAEHNGTALKPILKSPKKLQFNLSLSSDDDLFEDTAFSNSEQRFDELLTQINITQAEPDANLPDIATTQCEKKFFKSPRGSTGRTYKTKKDPKKKIGYRK